MTADSVESLAELAVAMRAAGERWADIPRALRKAGGVDKTINAAIILAAAMISLRINAARPPQSGCPVPVEIGLLDADS